MTDGLRFRSLSIRRMPGFPRGGLRLSELSPGINLIHGLNASGKTTTAAALQAALWSAAAPDIASLEARFVLDGAEWLVVLDHNRAIWQRDGKDTSAPPLPRTEDRDRYLLSLHDLLGAQDENLADKIRVESVGGFDLSAAANVLEFGAGGRPRRLINALDAARGELDKAHKSERELLASEGELSELEDRHNHLRAHAGCAEAINRALDAVNARKDEEAAERTLESFPAGLGHLHGNELDQLAEWDDDRESARRTDADADKAIADAAEEARETGLGEDGLAGRVLTELDERLDQLRGLDHELKQARDDREGALAERKQAGDALGISADRDPPPGPSADEADRLEKYIRRSQSLLARRHEVDAKLEWLTADPRSAAANEMASGSDGDREGHPGDSDADLSAEPDIGAATPDANSGTAAADLRDAVGHLRAWLRAPGASGATRKRHRIVLAAVILLGFTGFVAFPLGLPMLSLAAIAGAVASATVLFALRPREAPGREHEIQRQITRLGFEPASWSRDDVESALDELERRLADRRFAESKRQDAERIELSRSDLENAEKELETERGQIAADIGISPVPGDLALDLTAMRLRHWGDALRMEAAATALVEERDETRANVLAKAGELIEAYADVPMDAAGLAATMKDLRERQGRHLQATRTIESADSDKERAAAERERIEEKRTALFERLGLEVGQEQVLRDWMDQLEAYREAKKEAEIARRKRKEAEAAFTALDETEDSLLGKSALELDEERRRASDAAEELKDVSDKIATIRTRLADAREKHDVGDALANHAEAKAALRDKRDVEIDAEIGAGLLQWLRDKASDQGRPAVFYRARELFAEVTRHRYRLDLDAKGGPFRAYDTVTERGYAFEQLSSGTRIQLLLAVRIAFVETQEVGAALPLLLDEVLANSDDERARAIIDTAVELARRGRQVFYFTAQADELSKWRTALEAAGRIDWCMRNVAGHRAEESVIEWRASEPSPIPPPKGRSHRDYGRTLTVPPFDPWAEEIGELHLWYLVEDVELLYRLLSDGFTHWGQLDHYARNADDKRDDFRLDAHKLAVAPSLVCERFLQLWRHGRGRPVARKVLSDSGAVSNTFIDRVTALCEDVAGDASALIDGLNDRQIKGFRSSKIEDLENFLIEHGFIKQAEARTTAEIRQMLSTLGPEIAPDIGADAMDRLIGRLVHGPDSSD